MPPKKPPQPTFEQAIDELESIIERVETGEIGLEESLKAYEHGAQLIKRCRQILSRAEKRIAELVADADGDLTIAGEDEADETGTDEQSQLEGGIDEEGF